LSETEPALAPEIVASFAKEFDLEALDGEIKTLIDGLFLFLNLNK
jgi:hypothetical protein